ncbi:MAG: gluconate 2-dehydrogenase subunit 3 family protein [Acidobacteria bacterium]|nr:gluconate 2-dehydrogenase subunit 3 family protein [Acidobacteriota bacterium]
MSTTRREALYQIALTVTTGAARPQLAGKEHAAHHAAAGPAKPAADFKRRYFNEHEFKTLQALSQWIIPRDEHSGGGIEAGTAEFIDFMAATDEKLQAAFSGGLAWLDHHMKALHGKSFLDGTREQQKEMLDRIASRSQATPETAPGVEFFAWMRAWTVDAFYSSKAGIEDLGYIGNTSLAEFNGCPDEVVKKLLEKSPV